MSTILTYCINVLSGKDGDTALFFGLSGMVFTVVGVQDSDLN